MSYVYHFADCADLEDESQIVKPNDKDKGGHKGVLQKSQRAKHVNKKYMSLYTEECVPFCRLCQSR